MFYKMIEKKCTQWYESNDCNVKDLIQYIKITNQMRDAQIEAIQIYLFLKIKCECKPLSTLFIEGVFNSLDINELEISTSTRDYLQSNPAALAAFEYANIKNDKGEIVSKALSDQIKKNPQSVDYKELFNKTFYNVTYSDYLFSLPMGAGKTFLMAAFIYLDLYFAINEPANKAFAHNFIIFAPSGLKSSVVPSLKTIQKFNPSWIIPEPAASSIKKQIVFEVLDQQKTASKSNKTKNPNVQKIANYGKIDDAFGFVIVTNAEKVILDRIQEKNGEVDLIEYSDDEKDRSANELRNLIGKIPSLSVFIDEVHHAVSDEIKLRAVVNKWAEKGTINSVLGFSGTPYLDKVERLKISDELSIGTTEISNIVYYYPLLKGIGNFLKVPSVKIAEITDTSVIIENGVRAFFDEYKDTVYYDGTKAKLGIYCGSIEKLEQVVYPLVAQIVTEYGISTDAILKFHKGNKAYSQPQDSQLQFDTLDKDFSNIRVVLLVQIGKEGWDCHSLTGIILSQEGDCPTNMVLQTSCRCLRQVERNKKETALIFLNKSNAEKLEKQLAKQQHISLSEFQNGNTSKYLINRYNRMDYLKLPNVDFYQLRISYETIVEEELNIAESLNNVLKATENDNGIILTKTLDSQLISTKVLDQETGKKICTFNSWLNDIVKESFTTLSFDDLVPYTNKLQDIFNIITYEENGTHFYSSKYNVKLINANIRKSFAVKRSFTTKEELIPEEVSLLNISNFKSEIYSDSFDGYYPEPDNVEKIIKEDKGEVSLTPEIEKAIQAFEALNQMETAKTLRQQYSGYHNKDRSFHYLPYHTDSNFEITFLKEMLTYNEIDSLGLEVYYNGDRALTEFKIKCYKSNGKNWNYIGMYTPDFLIIKRKDNKIHKIIIVETKGQIYANDPTFISKKEFMETAFIKQNNDKYGYKRFDYLYLEDTLSVSDRILKTQKALKDFFDEE